MSSKFDSDLLKFLNSDISRLCRNISSILQYSLDLFTLNFTEAS
jgi:hypothetical protein